ncbi:MAG TPA: ABC transporter substrate-binding protein [Candidatus Limnocylindria bacterium]|nr:ABC transporter substrate-binding protein [Candidatus Limnocylindria bacterium]
MPAKGVVAVLRTRIASVLALALVLAACSQPAQPAPSAAQSVAGGEKPASGGTLVFIVNAEPPSFDGHRETTFALLHPIAPHYSLLYKFDPNDLTKVIPDVAAEMPSVSADKLTVTVKLRQDVKFHDGTNMTSEDVKATYDKIITPNTAAGQTSPRAGTYAVVSAVSAPDKYTIEFKLKYPSSSFLTSLASPWNFIYSAAKLKADPRFYEKNIMGTGPFLYDGNTKGQDWKGKRNPDYFGKDKDGTKLPYLDAYRALIITDANAGVNAIRSKQAMIEFRGFTPQQRDDLSRALPNDLAIQEAPWICVNTIAMNTQKKPFDDPRVRKALTLAIDRWAGSEALSKTTIVKDVGGLLRPKGPFAMSDADLQKVAGFSKDGKAAKDQAKKLLADAGVPNLSFKFVNRNITTPYEPVAVFLIDQWKQVGITATHDVKETSAYQADLRNGNFEVGLDFNCQEYDEPDLQLQKLQSASKGGKGLNFGFYDDAALDGMIDAQSRETDPAKRLKLVGDIERYAMDEKAYYFPVLWWYRIIPYLSVVRGWKIGSNHYTNQDLASVWLAKK